MCQFVPQVSISVLYLDGCANLFLPFLHADEEDTSFEENKNRFTPPLFTFQKRFPCLNPLATVQAMYPQLPTLVESPTLHHGKIPNPGHPPRLKTKNGSSLSWTPLIFSLHSASPSQQSPLPPGPLLWLAQGAGITFFGPAMATRRP